MERDNIFVEDLCKRFDDFALEHVSFRVPKGRIVGFVGENGAGKSTTMNLILNELKKDSGRIEIFGKEHTDRGIKEDIGVVFEECHFHKVFTATDLERIFAGIYQSWDSEAYHGYLKKFGLPEKQVIGLFSKGMKMKLSLSCALAHKPKLLLLDEATAGMDPVMRDEVLDLFLEFIQDEECSIFFSSHITSDIEKVADYVVLLHQGRILLQESKDDLLYRYGVMKCGKKRFASISTEDYLISRSTNLSAECLVCDRETAKRKYKDMVIDPASLEEILLFYMKGEMSCAG